MKEILIEILKKIKKDYENIHQVLLKNIITNENAYNNLCEFDMDHGICHYFNNTFDKYDTESFFLIKSHFNDIILAYLKMNNLIMFHGYIITTPTQVIRYESVLPFHLLFERRVLALEEMIGLVSCDIIKIN